MKFRKFGALLLFVLFVQALFPELIHELAGHEDTIDHPAAGTHISVQHIHCETLQDNLPVFNTAQSLFLPSIDFVQNEKIIQPLLFTEQLFQFHFQQRGPPSVC